MISGRRKQCNIPRCQKMSSQGAAQPFVCHLEKGKNPTNHFNKKTCPLNSINFPSLACWSIEFFRQPPPFQEPHGKSESTWTPVLQWVHGIPETCPKRCAGGFLPPSPGLGISSCTSVPNIRILWLESQPCPALLCHLDQVHLWHLFLLLLCPFKPSPRLGAENTTIKLLFV